MAEAAGSELVDVLGLVRVAHRREALARREVHARAIARDADEVGRGVGVRAGRIVADMDERAGRGALVHVAREVRIAQGEAFARVEEGA